MGNYTPAPWVWLDCESGEWGSELDEGLIMSGQVTVCNFGNNETYYNTAGIKPKPEDIALMCAAPDLLESLQWALRELQGENIYDDEIADKQCDACYAKAFAAIAKATNPPPATSL